MADLLPEVLKHLEALVSFDTRNPPRDIGTGGIFDYLRAQLPDFRITVTDHGAGAVSMLAVRGAPRRVFNVHLDTVPSSPAWSADPHVLRVTADRAIALGACDIKGAAAGLVAAARRTTGDAAFLFSTDEEANDARCIAAFLASDHGFDEAIVAEPTMGQAVLAHRGISSVLMKFRGEAGHASGAQARDTSALHAAMRWGGQAMDFVQAQDHLRFGGLTGLRFNIGRVEGGIKANMIAPSAELRFRCPRSRWKRCTSCSAASRRPACWRPTKRPSPGPRCRRATCLGPRSDDSPRATWPTNSACRSATPWTSGPRPRCSRRPG
jgi:acetylornithine deacetylase